jgi:MFS family permease
MSDRPVRSLFRRSRTTDKPTHTSQHMAGPPAPVGQVTRSRIGILRPLRLRDFRLLWTGMTVSLVGDGIFTVALAWQVYELSNVPTALSMVGVAWTLPMVLLLLPGGVASDRFDRRKVLIFSDVVRGVAIFGGGLLSVLGVLELWHMFVVAALFGIGESFFGPAFGAIVPEIVPKRLLVEANSLDQFVRPAGLYMAGPALGGWMIGWWGPGAAFLADAGTFVVSAACIAFIRPLPRTTSDGSRPIQEIKEGIRFVRSETWLWATLCAASVALLLFWGPLDVLLPFLVKNQLDGQASDLGFVFAAGGVGALLAAFVMGQIGLPKRHVTFMYLCWTISIGSMVLLGIAVDLKLVYFARFIEGGLATAGMVVWGTMMHRLVPDELLGRVSSVDWFISIGLVPVSFALTGPVSQWIGVDATFIAAGAGGALATIAFLLIPGIRDTEEDGRMREPEPIRTGEDTQVA